MSSAVALAPSTQNSQIEGANFLNLLVVDDERAIREVCREVAQSLGFNTSVADSAEHAIGCSILRTLTFCCLI